MNLLKWIAAGAVGGLVGAAIWAGISYFANYEIGWIAWAIGAIVGFSVRVAAGEQNEGMAPGATAVSVSIGAIVLGKYLASFFLVANLMATNGLADPTEEQMIVRAADDIVRERQARGQTVVFPTGKDLDTAETQADYPPDIWQQANSKWQALSADERTQQIKTLASERNAAIRALQSTVQSSAFYGSFSPFDLLWFGLAAATAYRLGAGNVGTDD